MTAPCPFCSHVNPGHAKFCNDCGSPLHLSPCRCGAVNPRGASACYQCGATLPEALGLGASETLAEARTGPDATTAAAGVAHTEPVTPEPSPQPATVPEPEPTRVPEPMPEPTPEPYPKPEPEPYPEPTPEPYPQPEPEPFPQPGPGPIPGTSPEPTFDPQMQRRARAPLGREGRVPPRDGAWARGERAIGDSATAIAERPEPATWHRNAVDADPSAPDAPLYERAAARLGPAVPGDVSHVPGGRREPRLGVDWIDEDRDRADPMDQRGPGNPHSPGIAAWQRSQQSSTRRTVALCAVAVVGVGIVIAASNGYLPWRPAGEGLPAAAAPTALPAAPSPTTAMPASASPVAAPVTPVPATAGTPPAAGIGEARSPASPTAAQAPVAPSAAEAAPAPERGTLDADRATGTAAAATAPSTEAAGDAPRAAPAGSPAASARVAAPRPRESTTRRAQGLPSRAPAAVATPAEPAADPVVSEEARMKARAATERRIRDYLGAS